MLGRLSVPMEPRWGELSPSGAYSDQSARLLVRHGEKPVSAIFSSRGVFFVRRAENRYDLTMGRKFKGLACAYCLEAAATTRDHVFSREFFLVEDRGNLPEAPACRKCNEEKSRMEHHLTAVLPFGGRHAQARENLETHVPPRLKKNRPLSRSLLESTKPAWIRHEGGIYQPTSVVEFDGKKLEALLKYIGRGLAWHHWRVYLRPVDEVIVMLLPEKSSALFQGLISNMRPEHQVEENLGRGTVQYVGIKAADPPQLTVWQIAMYGGLVLSDERKNADGESISCTTWWVFTGPPELAAAFARGGS